MAAGAAGDEFGEAIVEGSFGCVAVGAVGEVEVELADHVGEHGAVGEKRGLLVESGAFEYGEYGVRQAACRGRGEVGLDAG